MRKKGICVCVCVCVCVCLIAAAAVMVVVVVVVAGTGRQQITLLFSRPTDRQRSSRYLFAELSPLSAVLSFFANSFSFSLFLSFPLLFF